MSTAGNSAFLFPGQGSQKPGMLQRWREDAIGASLLDEARSVLGRDPLDCDSAAALAGTHAAQCALLIAGVAAASALERAGVQPAFVAGHSVGAFAAAVHAHVLTFTDALRLVDLRGNTMARAYPRGYGMAAIAGIPAQSVRDWIDVETSRGATLHLANLNAERQVTVSGGDAELARLIDTARRHGASKAVRLAVAVPSHSPLMAGVAEGMRTAMQNIHFRTARFPCAANRSARLLTDGRRIAEDLADAVAHPVRWHDITIALHEHGARVFIEMPPGDTLTRLVQAALPDARVAPLELLGIDGARELLPREGAPRVE